MPTSKNWVWIRGLGRGSAHWGEFAIEFPKHFPGAKIEMLDSAGNGERVSEKSFTSITETLTDLRSRSQFVKEKIPFNLLSISLGGMIAAEWAHLFPQDLATATLINSSDAGSSHPFERMRSMALVSVLKLAANADPHNREKIIFDLTVNYHPRRDYWIEEFANLEGTSKANLFRQLYSAGKYRFPKIKPPVKICVVNSMGDRLVDPECSLKIASMWGAPIFRTEKEGHDLPQENPTWLCQTLKRFL
jgi:pimeloyl-ACP methyl ester carboxylesterase